MQYVAYRLNSYDFYVYVDLTDWTKAGFYQRHKAVLDISLDLLKAQEDAYLKVLYWAKSTSSISNKTTNLCAMGGVKTNLHS